MEIFRNRISVGECLTPFMIAGVPSKKYDGDRNTKAFETACDAMLEQLARELGGKELREYDELEILGERVRFQAYAESPTYAGGSYTVFERYAAMPIYFSIESNERQKIKLGIYTDRCKVILNGKTVYDNPDIYSRPRPRVYVFEHQVKPNVEHVELELEEGDNSLLILTGRVARSSGFMFTAYLEQASSDICAKIPLSIDRALREKIYMCQRHTHMTDDSYVDGEGATLIVGGESDGDFAVEVTHNGSTELLPVKDGKVRLPEPRKIGRHTVSVVWRLPGGEAVAQSTYSYGIARVVPEDPGYDRYEARRRTALEDLAKKKDHLALYRLGRYEEITENVIFPIADRVIRREDCADFLLLPLLWLAWEDRGARRLSDSIHEKIKQAALSFKYWVDESGSSSMVFCSENHRIGFHVCEYLAGLLYPKDVFTNSDQNGLFHSLKGRMHIMEWLTQRSKMGFDEPHSDNYFPVTFSALLALREITPLEEYPIRNMVKVLLDFMVYIAATSMIDGVMGTPRGRSYSPQLRSKYSSPITPLCWMLFGNCSANPAGFSHELAFSYYVPPRALCELAEDHTPATLYFKEGLMHFDKYNADFTIRRTPEYIMGGVRDHNVGMCDMHFTPMFAALRGNIPIFISAPQNSANGMALRPDYFAGEAHLPRVLMHGRVLITIFHGVTNMRIWMTHCHFPKRRFDEVLERGGMTFGRKGDGYVAIWSSEPHRLSDEGEYAERELIADGRECVWMIACGSRDEDGDLDAFIEKMLASDITVTDNGGSLLSPDGEKFEFGLDEGFFVDGADVPIQEYLSLSPWLVSKYGSGKFEYSYKNYKHTDRTYPASV